MSKKGFKVGLIGAGGRGRGAVVDALAADPTIILWSVADIFPDHLATALEKLKAAIPDNYEVTKARTFIGFDGYHEVLKTDVDVVILTSPPAFRPEHFEAAVKAGKHVFMEKPVATDPSGIRTVLAATKIAEKKGLSVVAGTQRRHDVAYRECIRRIHEGAIGDVLACYAYWNQGGIWVVPREPGWTDMEWQLRNWNYFTWVSGDHIVEQHIHNIDVCNWIMKAHPVKAVSLGGRQTRTDPIYGQIFDHFATEFEYENGVKMISMCRQIDNTASRVSEHIVGSKGTSNAQTWIKGANPWRWEGERPNDYEEEHRHLLESIRSGKPLNEGQIVAESTLTAIMGRMAGYTGQEITWDMALNSTEHLVPAKEEFGDLPVDPVPVPGVTKFE
ncbi:MAG: Gfo/Idh/MocA family protein [Fimbriimonadales bacterium]